MAGPDVGGRQAYEQPKLLAEDRSGSVPSPRRFRGQPGIFCGAMVAPIAVRSRQPRPRQGHCEETFA
jgi:hypothetical protein